MREVGTAPYILKPSDTPWSVAHNMYGDGKLYERLTELNPMPWQAGSRIYIPNVSGIVYQLEEDASSTLALTQMGKPVNVASLSKFYKFNGGDFRQFKAGEEVFYPN